MANNDYRKVDGYEVHPLDITEKLVALANFGNDAESENQAKTDLENALYYLDTICQNSLNSDYFRTFYNVLAMITENKVL